MSNVTPIQMDANGITTFEKLEIQAINLPCTDAEVAALKKSGGSPPCQDQVSLSRPMKKHLEKKKSYFSQQTLSPQTLNLEQEKKSALTSQAQAYAKHQPQPPNQLELIL